ncbi:FadR/GntR family transcriptional regulator [Neptunomonas phycophila]|uniref:FadR/GntR family transcriptional regulator n=1 Tax=Neptunomonas phycophila TaxID=1572645 RepID=A0ABT9EVU7_9GAMM|nr:FadR/GntR family transcriptional regulator [Neptunomonas phycophila]MDO6469218.1 FadR/GntR family transcriptional regulator [Neptunomonas phycophila]MDP2523042.1 FadR/GntR family transcriptional regulator [Neptunomonas phycophila]
MSKGNAHISNSHQSLGAIVYEQILASIIDGTYALNTKLPAETQLCKELNVSRPVLREALARLREDELIASRRGSGSYVIKQPDNVVLQFSPLSSIADIQRCFEFRATMEAEAAALAAKRKTPAQLDVIISAYEKMNEANVSSKLATDEDFAFHLAITNAANNHFYSTVLQSLEKSITDGINITRNLSLRHSSERLKLVQAEHHAIIVAIKEGDSEAAREAMRDHINNARNRMFDGPPS